MGNLIRLIQRISWKAVMCQSLWNVKCRSRSTGEEYAKDNFFAKIDTHRETIFMENLIN